MRIDKLLFELGLAKSREAASRMIKDGSVLLNHKTVTKPSFDVPKGEVPEIVGETLRYVSRGGLKLERALEFFSLDVTGLDCVDIGASTGGFTDCLLQNGAAKVRCVDVGRAQLDKNLEADYRVTSYEGMNARYIVPEDIGGKCDIAVCDVSFISLTLILEAVSGLIEHGGSFVALIKPQFEAGRGNIGKGGIVKDRNVHAEVIDRVISRARDVGLYIVGLCVSPILGGDGNREYLSYFSKSPRDFDRTVIKKTVFDT